LRDFVAFAHVLPVFFGLFALLGVGVLLRARGRMGPAHADALQGVIGDVTVPAMLVCVLGKSGLDLNSGPALVGPLVAVLACAALAIVVVALRGGDRRARGAAALAAGFANTGYLGLPLVFALFGDAPGASSTAVVINIVCTTLLLWTVAVPFAQRMGATSSATSMGAALGAALLNPATVAVVVGLVIHGSGVVVPPTLLTMLGDVGACTGPLVFLSLGLTLDTSALRGQLGTVLALSVVKLLVSPLVAWLVVRALHVPSPISDVAVLQAAMPTALITSVVVASSGCNRALAAGVTVATTVLSLVTLPLVMAWVLP
jgi:hypothetical protein